jgi:hypothetical protein
MVNLKEVSTQELIEELVRRLKTRQSQIKTEIEDYQDALRGLDLAEKLTKQQT